VLEPFRPEVVVVPGWASRAALAAAHWAQQHSVPTVVMSESTAWDEARKPWKEFIKRQIVASFSAVLVGGRPHADYLAQLGLPQDRIFLGYDAVDNDYFATKVAAVRSQTSTRRPPTSDLRPLASPYFLASARFIEKKNLPRLLQAYARYRQLASASTLHAPRSTLPEPWHLVLLGDGPLRPALSSQLHALGLQHSVLLPGFKQYPELPTYYGPASAFIHASTTEQWGLVVNEAMASGLPVLVSNRCGCARDLVREGENGFTFDPFNVEEMAQLMHKISAFNFPLSAFGDASARIIANWSPARFASGLKQAVACALRVRSVQPTLVQRAILAALLRR
jgi:glycosyltransferase involved in cell wall biosynthesis